MPNRLTIALAAIFLGSTALAGLPNPPPTGVAGAASLWLIVAGAAAVGLATRLHRRT